MPSTSFNEFVREQEKHPEMKALLDEARGRLRPNDEWRRPGHSTLTIWEARCAIVLVAIMGTLVGVLVGYMVWA